MSKKIRWIAPIIALGCFALGCGLFYSMPTQVPVGLVFTDAARTYMAQMTLSAGHTAILRLTEIAFTATASVSATLPLQTPILPTATLLPPTFTPVTPSATPQPPTVTPIQARCDHAQFVKDVTVGEGAFFPPDADFMKIWRIKNIGSCTWNEKYSLIFIGGDYMGTAKVFPYQGKVYPGNSIDIAVDLSAPDEEGKYRSKWMLMNASNVLFGIGENAASPISAVIKVLEPNEDYAYDFAINMCLAEWRSSDGGLPCPGDSESDMGSVVLLTSPILEKTRHENEPALWMRPEMVKDGWIKGVYPAYKVKANDYFLAEIGCLADSQGCGITFTLDYQISGKPVKHLGEWNETYDGHIRLLDIDLSGLAGKTVQFSLKVTNTGKTSKANAFWLVPSIRRVSPTRTPTATLLPTGTQTQTSTTTVTQTTTATASATATATATATVTLTATP